jgi:hypothetical protein
MSPTLTDIDLQSVCFICDHLREQDKREIFATLPHDNTYRLGWEAYHQIRNMGRGRIAWHKGRPVALGAFTEDWPTNWQVIMFGTDEFKAGAFELLKWFRREAADILTTQKANRLYCNSHIDHVEAHKMIMALGAEPEGPPMRGFGKDGSTFQRFVWFPDTNAAVLRPDYVRPKEMDYVFRRQQQA